MGRYKEVRVYFVSVLFLFFCFVYIFIPRRLRGMGEAFQSKKKKHCYLSILLGVGNIAGVSHHIVQAFHPFYTKFISISFRLFFYSPF